MSHTIRGVAFPSKRGAAFLAADPKSFCRFAEVFYEPKVTNGGAKSCLFFQI